MGCSPWAREESDMTERLHFHFSVSCIAKGNGNSLQCSCLESPRDGGAWWAAVYGVTQSRTRLKQLCSSSSRSRDCFSRVLFCFLSFSFHFFCCVVLMLRSVFPKSSFQEKCVSVWVCRACTDACLGGVYLVSVVDYRKLQVTRPLHLAHVISACEGATNLGQSAGNSLIAQ